MAIIQMSNTDGSDLGGDSRSEKWADSRTDLKARFVSILKNWEIELVLELATRGPCSYGARTS